MRRLFTSYMCCLFLLSIYAQSSVPVYLDNSKSIEERVEDVLLRMTLKEKIAMVHANSKFGSEGCPRLGIPEIWMSDGPHGVRPEFTWDKWESAGWSIDSCTAFPALVCLAATWNVELPYVYGKALGEEARYRNKDVLLGPGVNIYRTPMNGRNFEYMGEDPYLASRLVVPYIKGLQSNGVAACLKHFALNNQEHWRGHINVEVSDRALHEIYLPAFKAGVLEGKVWSVMGAYNKFRGHHCCHNDLLLNKILKRDWKFDGVVISDWGGTHDTDEAVANGLDIEMGTWTDGLSQGRPFAYNDYFLADAYEKGVKDGRYTMSGLDEKVRRILRLVFRTNMSGCRPYGSLASPEHAAVAREIAEEGIVLLKNENHLFPVSTGKYRRIAVIGENAVKSLTVGGGSSELKVREEVSPLQGLVEKYGKDAIVYSAGYSSSPHANADSLRKVALDVARNADIVLFVGGLNKDLYQDCEGDDRKNFCLPYGQDKLINGLLGVNRNLGIVLISGNGVSMPWIDKVPALVQSWYLGSEAGHAIANVVSGDVNPSGKLPFSIPKKLEDNSAQHFGTTSYPGDSINVIYKDDILVGYRWHDTKKIPALFPFGYGLSYTEFEYGKLKTDKDTYVATDTISLSLTLANKGKVNGKEVVQVYASQSHPSVLRPMKELKAFRKVFLEAGTSTWVNFRIPVKDLAFFDDKRQAWVVEPDRFVLHVASSSTDIKRKRTINVK